MSHKFSPAILKCFNKVAFVPSPQVAQQLAQMQGQGDPAAQQQQQQQVDPATGQPVQPMTIEDLAGMLEQLAQMIVTPVQQMQQQLAAMQAAGGPGGEKKKKPDINELSAKVDQLMQAMGMPAGAPPAGDPAAAAAAGGAPAQAAPPADPAAAGAPPAQ